MDWWRLAPPFWIQNTKTSNEWDELLNQLMDENTPVAVGKHSVRFGSIEVWTSNFPYDYGHPWRPWVKVLPKVSTRLRLRKLVGEPPEADQLAAIKAAMNTTQ